MPPHRRTSRLLAGPAVLTLATFTLTAGATTLAAGPAAAADGAWNELVALTSETQQQLPFESDTSGSGQTTSRTGQYTVFSTDAPLVEWDDNETTDVYLRDAGDDVTVLVSSVGGVPGNDISFEPTISADGRYVAFTTWADNLTKKDTNGHTMDVVVKDMQQDTIVLASVTSAAKQMDGNSISPVISDDGSAVSFQTFAPLGPRDQDRREDVYVRDLDAGRTMQASLSPKGDDIKKSVLNGDISANGDLVIFGINDSLWVRDVSAGSTKRFWHEPKSPPCQPLPAGSAGRPVISGNGRYVAFSSCALSLPGEDGEHSDIYRVELATGKVTRMSPQGNADSYLPSLSSSGRYLGFSSDASDLVPGDDEGHADVFVLDSRTGSVTRASEAPDGSGGDSESGIIDNAISGDGQTLVYVSYAENLVAGDRVHARKVFAWHAHAPLPD